MRCRRRRRFPARYRGTNGKTHALRRLLILCGVLLLVWGAICELLSRAVTDELAHAALEDYLREQINEAVREELADCEGDFSTLGEGGDGQITYVTADTRALNALKTGVLSRLEKTLNRRAKAGVPMGSLTGWGVLNGRGPRVPLRFNLQGSADVAFDTAFTSAGVNQSCHRVTMTVTAHAYSQSVRFETEARAETVTVLCETVVVGAVPHAALLGGLS